MAATARAADRQARGLHHDARPRRARPDYRRRLRAARRHADGDDHRAKGRLEPETGKLSDRRYRFGHDAAHQDGGSDRERRRPFRPWCGRRSASRSSSGPARCILNCRKTSPTRRRRHGADPAPSDRFADRVERRARSSGATHHRRRAPADHAGRRREPATAFRRAVGIRSAGADPVLQHADGQGRRHWKLGPVYGNRGAVGARLRPSGDRPRGFDHHRRPRHGGEASVPYGPGWTDGAARRLPAGDGGRSVLSASGAHRRRRAQPHAFGRSART